MEMEMEMEMEMLRDRSGRVNINVNSFINSNSISISSESDKSDEEFQEEKLENEIGVEYPKPVARAILPGVSNKFVLCFLIVLALFLITVLFILNWHISVMGTVTPKSCPFKTHPSYLNITGHGVLRKHITYFASQDKITLTIESMTLGHTIQNIYDGVALKVNTILSQLGNEPHLVSTLMDFCNPASTNIWDNNGDFNQTQFNRLISKKIIDNGKEIITRKIIHDFRTELHGEQSALGLGSSTVLYWLIPVPWISVTDGSFNELFEYYADHWFKNENGIYEKALTVNQLFLFYTDPNTVMQLRVEKNYPIPPPQS